MTSQFPKTSDVFLDHIAHFVPKMDEASEILSRLGFVLTPFTHQQNSTSQGLVPAGTANRCVMLRTGYVEILSAVSGTELARRMRTSISRYTGLHLIALSVADAARARDHLASQGFEPDPPVHLRRSVEREDGTEAEAGFTVVRVQPGKMPEGRIQILTHHTEEVVWQPRWLTHDNAISSLEAVLLAVEDPQEAATRFGRFAGRRPERRDGNRWVLALDRGLLVFSGSKDAILPGWAAGSPATLPMICGYALGSDDPSLTDARFEAAGVAGAERGPDEVSYVLPLALGGFLTVTAVRTLPSWAR